MCIRDSLTAGALVRVPPLPDAPPREAREGISERDAAFARSLVLYEDEEVLVLNKPAGLAVQGGTKTSRHICLLYTSLPLDAQAREAEIRL